MAAEMALQPRLRCSPIEACVRESYWKEAVHSLEGRASFDMQCPTVSLEFLLLQRKGIPPPPAS
jgi:hypothetical protein